MRAVSFEGDHIKQENPETLCTMTMNEAVLLERVKESELQQSQKIKPSALCISAIDAALLDCFSLLSPRPSDYRHRRDLVQKLDMLIKETYGFGTEFPVVAPFGSFVMDMFAAKSDLDLSINFSNNATDFPRDKKIEVLEKLAEVLYGLQRKGRFYGVEPILGARVPIVKAFDSSSGIECDISVENRDGITRSLILGIISSIDDRFQKLSFLMKVWAKAHDINSAKDHTLNSLSIILIVAFHLQTRDPPILPPLSVLLKDEIDISSLKKAVNSFQHYGKQNKESIGELFVSLLTKLEDFLDGSQNTARVVRRPMAKKIYRCIKRSITHISRFMKGQVEVHKLKELLFGVAVLVPRPIKKPKVKVKRKFPSITASASTATAPPVPIETKRTRHIESRWTGTTANNLPLGMPSFPHRHVPMHRPHVFPNHVPAFHQQLTPALVSFVSPHYPRPSYVPPQVVQGVQHLPPPPFAPYTIDRFQEL
ncbi:hypothetical protein QJS04_geneDACA002170 [Acorus gramineus]|uniref:Poly(A) RNA polymerase mitochondrial-like central palm domain-containing protein n=1 Tax=Acorus gramineus TaxID=55184 RepID=A0AAV9A8I8_ACOGR|nr:hypothetical protein QJS04_geneDACA002170 [Acorus gramineus]